MAALTDRKGMASIFGSAEQSPDTTWTPFFDGISEFSGGSRHQDMHAFTALESLQMDDLINNDIGSSSDSSASDTMKNPTSSLHHLPAWSTTEDGDDWCKASPANSEGAVGNEKIVNDVWFAPSSITTKKKRTTFNKAAMLAEDREISPGANTNLKSHKSAPQLVQRVSSADHRAKLEDLLVEMGWPRQGQSSEGETVDGNQGGSRMSYSNQGGGGSGGNSSNHPPSGGNGSLASGMPVTSALFRRRALMREGEMPSPAHVEVPASQSASLTTSIPLMDANQGGLAFGLSPHQYSKSATLPVSFQSIQSMMPTMVRPPLSTHASTSALATTLSSSADGGNLVDYPTRAPLTAREKQEGIARAIHAAMNSGLDPRRESASLQITTQPPQQFQMRGSPVRRPESSIGSTSTSTTELQTPVTPFQHLNSTPEIGSMASPYGSQQHLSPHNAALSTQFMPTFPTSHASNRMKSMQDVANTGTLSNALGLQYIPALPQNQPPTMIDSSAYAQIFATLPAFQQQQHQQQHHQQQQQQHMHMQHQQAQQMGIKQMRSSPNLRRTTSSVESAGLVSPVKSPIRKIASNRRLAASAADHLSSMPSPTKSPMKKGKSPKMTLSSSGSASIPLPPMPSFMTSSTSNPGPTAFEFVNYGIEDADELCSAVAPSGSYKIPLKGFGGSQDGEEGEEDGDGDDEDGEKKTRSRSRSKSSNRFGPRWQGVDEDDNDRMVMTTAKQNSSSPSADSDTSSGRQLKRIKSEANLAKTSPLKRKTASSINLRRRD